MREGEHMPGRPDSSDALFWLVEETIERPHQAIRLGQTSCVEIVTEYIERARAYNGVASALVTATPQALSALASQPHRTGRVFRQRSGKPYRATDDSNGESYGGQIRGVWHGARIRAGIERRVTPHSARHTWATWHHAAHRDAMKLRNDVGWTTISQVERYAKLAPQGLVPEILAFWGTGAPAVQVGVSLRATA
jgi:integrase